MAAELTHQEMLRYNRQIMLRGFDFDGQERLKASCALIAGLGGLGSAAALYLAAAGIGRLVLVDFDTVSLSNLQRQVLHNDSRIGQSKVASARQALAAVNPHVTLKAVDRALDDEALSALLAECDIVLDCTDNVAAREQLNRCCYPRRVPLISGAAIRMEGQISVFRYQPGEPCYRCLSRLFGAESLTCTEAGVMGPLVGIIGALQAMEAVKVLTDYGQSPVGKLVMLDAMTLQLREMRLQRHPHCEVCGAP